VEARYENRTPAKPLPDPGAASLFKTATCAAREEENPDERPIFQRQRMSHSRTIQTTDTAREFLWPRPFPLEAGGALLDLRLAYRTWGVLNEAGDNAVWVLHALTGDSDAAAWWPGLIGPGRALDTDRYYVVCANMPGSCY